MLIAGSQLPGIPFIEVAVNVNVPPEQIAATCANVGVTGWFTVTVCVAGKAHCPTDGVKVYVVVAVLLIAGSQLPGIPFIEVAGNINVPPEQIAAICANVGTAC